MKITIYDQHEIPLNEDADQWVHYIYVDSSGWVGIEDLDEYLDDIDICEEIIKQMETKSGMENDIHLDEINEEISNYRYNRTELDNGTTVIVASPYRGERTIFIV